MKLFKRDIYIIGNRPREDWERIFIVTVVLIVFVSIYNAFFYKGIESQSFLSDDALSKSIQSNGLTTASPAVSAKGGANAGSASTSSSLNLTSVNSSGTIVSNDATVDKTDANYIIDLYRSKNIKYLRALADFGK